MFFRSLVAAGLLTLSAAVSSAATVTDIATTAGSSDFFSSGGGAVSSLYHPAYAPNSDSSEWVWDENLALPVVTFTHTFDLTGFDHTTAYLSGIWGGDNVGTAYLNGTAISSLPSGQAAFVSLTAFDAASGFAAGMNTLSFTVSNTGEWSTRNPAAFRAEALITASPVPVPASGLLLLSGFGAFAALRRRKTKA